MKNLLINNFSLLSIRSPEASPSRKDASELKKEKSASLGNMHLTCIIFKQPVQKTHMCLISN